MQENRSFDHYFGTMAGVRGFDDPKALQASERAIGVLPAGRAESGWLLLPFHLDTRATSAQKIPSTSHAWDVQHEVWNDGKMDRWLPAHRKADGANGPYVMGYYTRADIPFQLPWPRRSRSATPTHCSVLGPTWPNRMYWMTGTIDPEGKTAGRSSASGAAGGIHLDHLCRAPGGGRRQLEGLPAGGQLRLQHAGELSDLSAGAPGSAPSTRGDGTRARRASSNTTRCNDKLPAVSWIIPTSYQSEHPDYMPAEGRPLSRARSMPSPPIPRCGRRRFSS